MANFTPVSAAIGGALIGLSAALLMLLTGRIAGISGIFGGCLGFGIHDKAWRSAFIAGLILAPLTASWVGYAMPSPRMTGGMTLHDFWPKRRPMIRQEETLVIAADG
jgi:hypothetical protein